MMFRFFILFVCGILLSFLQTHSDAARCSAFQHKSDYNHNDPSDYSLVSSCFDFDPKQSLSKAKQIGQIRYTDMDADIDQLLNQCIQFAIRKKAMAFNFNRDSRLCRLFDCPETDPTAFSSAVNRQSSIDVTNATQTNAAKQESIANTTIPAAYFSLFANLSNFNETGTTLSTTALQCIPSIGLFRYHSQLANYSQAKQICERSQSKLAHVASETRTQTLAIYLRNWSRQMKNSVFGSAVAYIGLASNNTTAAEDRTFWTSLDNPLDCYMYRAWATGHPKRYHHRDRQRLRHFDQCTLLNSEREWKSTDCEIRLPFICEFRASSAGHTQQEQLHFLNSSCSNPTTTISSTSPSEKQPI